LTGHGETMKRLSVPLILAILVCACSSPTSPRATGASYTVSGVVVALTAAGLTPVEDVRVMADAPAGSRNHDTLTATTGKDGLYSLTVDAGVRSLLLMRDGYVTAQKSLTVSGDTRFDIQIVRVATYSLSGVVFEMTSAGVAPVEGVEVYCDSCGEYGHTFAYTDANGFYNQAEAHAGITALLIYKNGYDVVGATTTPGGFGMREAMVNGDTRFDIQVVRR
jgi:hypothetical protein